MWLPGKGWPLVAVPWLFVFGAAYYVGHPFLQSAPLTHDHPTHLFKAWHMATHLLPSLRLRGFSHFWAFGFPSDELVPPGEELWVLLFRLLTFGQLDWFKTYGIAIFALLFFSGASAYRFARHYFGTLAGVIAAVIVVWDAGHWATGGWFWMAAWGVWPVTLGVSCLLMTVVSFETLLEHGTPRQFASTGLWVAATLLAHQATVLFLPVMLALVLLDHWLRRGTSTRQLAFGMLACAFGAALVGFYLVPMLARTDQTLDLGHQGDSFEDVAKALTELRLFNGSWPGFVLLAFVGAIAGFKRRLPGIFFVVVGAVTFVTLSTDVLIGVLHLERLMPSLVKIEALRMLMGAKPLWFSLAAYAMSLPFEGVRRSMAELRTRPSRVVASVMSRWTLAPLTAMAALYPYVGPSVTHYKMQFIDKRETASEQVAFLRDLKPLWEYTAALRKASSEHYRIAYFNDPTEHVATLAPIFDDTLIYKVGNTPSQCFYAFPELADPRLFRALSVKYAVSDHPLDAQLYTEERRFGSLTLYRFKDFSRNPFTVLGAGQAELVEFSPERIRVRVRGTDAESRLKLHVSYMDHWRARQGGKTLRIVPATTYGIEDPFLMEVPVGDGEVSFEYVRRASDWIGLALSLAALPAFAAAYYVALRRPRWVALLKLPLPPRRALRLASGAAALAVIALLAARYRGQKGVVKKDSLFLSLADGEMKADGVACTRDDVLHFTCGPREVKAERVQAQAAMHLCYTTSASSLEIRTKAKGDVIAGNYDPRDGEGTLHAWLDDRDLGSAPARPANLRQQWVQFDARARKRDGSSTLRIEVTGSPLQCFDFRVVN